MKKIQGISKQEQCQYLLLMYLFGMQEQLGIVDKRLYEGVVDYRTFVKLKNALQVYKQSCPNSLWMGDKKGESEV